jgi:ATP-binding cassette subfamily C (CFTR/MRP) protein 1
MVLCSLKRDCGSKATLPAAILSLAGMLPLGLLLYYDHRRSIRPSSVLNLFLGITLLLDIARVRTVWLVNCNVAIAILASASLAWKIALLVAMSTTKRSLFEHGYQHLPPEQTSGLYGYMFSAWLFPTLWTGDFQSKGSQS